MQQDNVIGITLRQIYQSWLSLFDLLLLNEVASQ